MADMPESYHTFRSERTSSSSLSLEDDAMSLTEGKNRRQNR